MILQEGLRRVLSDTPVRRGYLEGLVSWRPQEGLVGRLEAGYHPVGPLGLFAFGQWDRLGPSAGAGARVEW